MKRESQKKFDTHVGEKEKVRELKNESKKKAMEYASILCATFDLQQVMYLPMSRESSICYKRRLSNYNLAFYNISHFFLWDETQSKRGSSEISTSVHTALQFYDSKVIKKHISLPMVAVATTKILSLLP